MPRKISMAFDPDGVRIPLDQLLPIRKITYRPESSEKHQCIAASIREVGVIEPFMVYPQKGSPQKYIILDGNIRYAILIEMGKKDVLCLIATDDEAYTYNHKVSVVTAIQEHFMILKAIGQGVSEKRIASTLNVDVGAIRRKQNLLEGICPEAVQLLKDRRVSPDALRELKRVISIRQIEMADLMCSVNNYTSSYAHSLFIATPEEQRVPECRPKKGDSLSADDRDRMRHEMQNLHRELKLIEKTHSENVLNLVVAVRYVQALMENSRVYKFLVAHFPEIAKEFQEIIDTPELAGSASRGKG